MKGVTSWCVNSSLSELVPAQSQVKPHFMNHWTRTKSWVCSQKKRKNHLLASHYSHTSNIALQLEFHFINTPLELVLPTDLRRHRLKHMDFLKRVFNSGKEFAAWKKKPSHSLTLTRPVRAELLKSWHAGIQLAYLWRKV